MTIGKQRAMDGKDLGEHQSPRQTAPGARNGHRMAYDAARAITWLFGGTDDNQGPLGDTWGWDGTAWNGLACTGPEARSWHTMAYDSERKVVVLFGGRNALGKPLGDTWEWNGEAWRLVSAQGPPARDHHAMAYDFVRNRMVLHGGYDGTQVLQDTWEWDGRSWSQATLSGPPARAAHWITFDPRLGRTLLYGGLDLTTRVFADTWTWDGEIWSKVETAEAAEEDGRTHFSMTYDATYGSVVRFGGKDWQRVPYGDLWQFEQGKWVLEVAEGPPARIDPVLVFDQDRKSVVLFGGRLPDEGGQQFGDAWEWDGTGWRQR
jgi:hypothetical protein